jgi:YqaJ-like viral recombinase domain
MLKSIRVGMFSASEFHKLMTCEKKPNELPIGAMTYIYKKVAEELAETKENTVITPAMEHGNLCEELAVDEFERLTGIDLYATGDYQQTIVYSDIESPLFGHVVGTPDAVIVDEFGEIISGVEFKCPDSHTHVFNLVNLTDAASLKSHYSEYYWQVIGYLLLTGAQEWHFSSFDPRFHDESNKMHYFKITRNDDEIKKLINRLTLAIQTKISILNKLKG